MALSMNNIFAEERAASSILEDPTVTMVNNIDLGFPEFAVGIVLLSFYVILELISAPINLVRDSAPISTAVVRTREEAFLPAYKMGYNFTSRYVYPGGGLPRLHYLDEGPRHARQVLVLLHGEPFWSHCWMKIIPLLTQHRFRVVAPDLIGFGKSDKFVDYRMYNSSMHKASLRGLLNHLKMHNDLTLVGHNWGWMIGSGLAKDFPSLFSRFVILNTNNLPDGEVDPSRYRDPAILPRFLIINAFFMAFSASTNFLRQWFPLSLLVKSLNFDYTKKEIAAFLAPHRNLAECGGTTALPLMVPIYPSHPEAGEMREIRTFLARSSIPTLIAYSETALLPWVNEGDFVVGNRLPFYADLTNSENRVYRVPGGGHIIMYDQPDTVANLIISFLISR